MDPSLTFNGLHASDGTYRIPKMSLAQFAATTRHRRRTLRKTLPRYISGSDLSRAGWGVVFGNSVEPEVREALAPLLEKRRAQAGDLFRDQLQSEPGADLIDFLKANGGSLSGVVPHELPYHLLLVGGPEDLSFELQAELSLSYSVGRLSFETPDEYAYYASNVVAVEAGDVRRDRRIELFCTRHHDDDNSRWAERYLVEPLEASLEHCLDFEIASTWREHADKARLKQLLGEDSPALLFASCHGVNFWPNDAAQEFEQGALLCSDWPGPRIWGQQRLPGDFYLSAGDVESAVDLRGLIAFFFSCYGIGTPTLDTFDRSSRENARRLTHRDLMSALPRRLLGIPRGALAVLGHVDQAWCHSYYWQGLGSQIGHFEIAIKSLLHGEPIGMALDPFARRLGVIDSMVIDDLEERRLAGEEPLTDDARQTLLWTAHYDAFYYVLLGDPAVRLPSAGAPIRNPGND